MERRSSSRSAIDVEAFICRAEEKAAACKSGTYPNRSSNVRPLVHRHEIPISIGRVVNISRDGIFLATRHRGAEVGDQLEVDLLVRNAGVDGYAHCRFNVVRKDARGYALVSGDACRFTGDVIARLHKKYLRGALFDAGRKEALAG